MAVRAGAAELVVILVLLVATTKNLEIFNKKIIKVLGNIKWPLLSGRNF